MRSDMQSQPINLRQIVFPYSLIDLLAFRGNAHVLSQSSAVSMLPLLTHSKTHSCAEVLQKRAPLPMRHWTPPVHGLTPLVRRTENSLLNRFSFVIWHYNDFHLCKAGLWHLPRLPVLHFARSKSISALLTMPKPVTVRITINCGKFWKRWEYQTT